MTTQTTGEYEHLSASECWAHLRMCAVGRIAFPSDDGGVEVFPINFVIDHGSIVFRTAAGTKLSGVTRHHRLTFEADGTTVAVNESGTEVATLAWSVIAKGAAADIRAHGELLEAFELDVQPWHEGAKPTFVRLNPEELTGRRFVVAL